MMWGSFTIIGFILRGELYREFVTYEIEKVIFSEYTLDPAIANYINQHREVYDRHFTDLRDIIVVAEKITSDRLTLSDTVKYSDPNITFRTGKANDEGYSAFYSIICDYLLKKNNIDKVYDCQHIRGQVYLKKTKLSAIKPLFRFVKRFPSHFDFNVIFEKQTGRTIALDPSLYETYGISEVSLYRIYKRP